MHIGSLFAGIGGFDLAARWMGWQTAWYSEIEPYACRVMARHFPEAINHGDIRSIRGEAVEPVDILCGGFPCQDISVAGKGAGLAGERSGLWSEYARLIEEIRPCYVVAENVSALRSRGLDEVLRSLDEIGYDAEWHCIPAAYVGAPHRRDRTWIVAYPNASGGGLSGHDGRRPEDQYPVVCPHVADANCPRPQGHPRHGPHVCQPGRFGAGQNRPTGVQGLCGGGHAEEWWDTEPAVGRVAYGVPARVDRLRCLGNAIVPQVAHMIFQAIAHREASRNAGLSHI